MKNIETILAEAGLTLTDEQKAAITKGVAENYKTAAEFDKKVGTLTTERDSFRTQYEDAKKSLEGFNGVDIDAMKQQISDANQKIKDAEDNAKKALSQRDYSDAVKAQLEGIAFTSNAAKKAFTEDLTAKNLPIQDGKLLGFDDYLKAYKEADKGAIVDKNAADNQAVFTTPMGTAPAPMNAKEVEQENLMRSAMGLPPIGASKTGGDK